MVSSFVEREVKFDARTGFVLPSLDGVLPEGARVETRSEHLSTAYYDTADHALLGAGVTLRRRTGTSDTGWQLKIPHEPYREEIHSAAEVDDVPEELHRLVVGITAGRRLTRIANLVTERSVTRIVDAQGGRLVEVDDDTVHAAVGGEHAAIVSTWREIEVENGEASGDGVELLDTVAKLLRKTGAKRSRSTSKLARALGSAAAPPEVEAGAKDSAGIVLHTYIEQQYRMLVSGDLALRRGNDTVIHSTRVATRRLRSTLRVFAALFDVDRAAVLDAELRWLAGELGEVRDRQVLRKRLHRMIDEVDAALLLGPVRARVDGELDAEQAEHWQRLSDDLGSDRYFALLADVRSWVQQPPVTERAGRAATTLTRYVTRADRQVARKLRRANSTGDVHLLHGARKAAKRARYAAESAEPVLGRRAAAKDAKLYRKLQDLLGEHQDSLVSSQLLRRLGAIAGTTGGENGFAFGILHEREERNAEVARRKARTIAKRYG